jgi:hypothetical protein
VLAATSATTDPGAAVTLDASGSTDPDGRSLSFAWTITSQPAGATPILTEVDTPTPSFVSTTVGTYRISLTVTATDGQTASAIASVLLLPPAGQTYVYLASDPGDYIGAGGTYLYTPADVALTVTATGGHLSVDINGSAWWYGDFAEGSALGVLAPGLYDQLTRYPLNDPARGGLSWSGEGRGCNTLTGWFAIDSVAYSGNALSSIDLRFEQHCEGGTPALHGQLHWTAAGP